MTTPTSTLTLTDFLLARITEDEAMAVQASAGESTRWREDRGEVFGEGWTWRRLLLVDDGNQVSSIVAEHAARFDPSRVLAECEAKRRIVEMHRIMTGTEADPICDRCSQSEQWPCETLCALALPYADHPDYRDEWRA